MRSIWHSCSLRMMQQHYKIIIHHQNEIANSTSKMDQKLVEFKIAKNKKAKCAKNTRFQYVALKNMERVCFFAKCYFNCNTFSKRAYGADHHAQGGQRPQMSFPFPGAWLPLARDLAGTHIFFSVSGYEKDHCLLWRSNPPLNKN